MKKISSSWIKVAGVFAVPLTFTFNPLAGVALAAALYKANEITEKRESEERKVLREIDRAEFKRKFYARQRWATYEDYLESDTWRTKSQKVMNSAAGQCQLKDCTSRATEVHHKYYPSVWGMEKEGTLIALCHPCHMAVHSGEKRVPQD